jgi:ABC-type nitrate/sulfonate/bicarbonate transport system substrate-binding protein
MTYFKAFMKKVKTHLEKENPDRVAGFVEGAKEAANWINKNFDEFQL